MHTSAPAWPSASAMERPIPELAPVTIAFWPFNSLRFSVFGTTGFGKSPKSWKCGIFGFERLTASGVIVGISFLVCGFVEALSKSLQRKVRQSARNSWRECVRFHLLPRQIVHEQRQRFRFHHYR